MSELLTPNSMIFFTKVFYFSKLIEDSLGNFIPTFHTRNFPVVDQQWALKEKSPCGHQGILPDARSVRLRVLGESANPLALLLGLQCVSQSDYP